MKNEMKIEEIEKLEEAARKYSGVDKIRLAFWDGAKWDRQSRIWTNDKVIEFTNWYLKLNRISPRYELENQTVIDSFLNGDPVDAWDNQYTPTRPEHGLHICPNCDGQCHCSNHPCSCCLENDI